MSEMICTRFASGSAAGAGATAGAGCATCGRGGASGTVTCLTTGRVAKIGAGCGPFCMNSALMKIAKVASVAITMPTNSRGWWPIATATIPARPSSAGSGRLLRLRTFFDPDCGGNGRKVLRTVGDELDGIGGRPLAFAIDRQAHRHLRAFAEAAGTADLAAMQAHK